LVGEGFDFVGHDRESAASLSSPRSLDARVDGQQVVLRATIAMRSVIR